MNGPRDDQGALAVRRVLDEPGGARVRGRIGEWAFAARSLLPIPFVALGLALADPTPAVFLAGSGLAALGAALRLAALRHSGPKTRSTGKVRADGLAVGGPYAHLRNPLYAGNLLCVLGLLVATGSAWLAALGPPAFFLVYGPIVATEERYLGERFGEPYREFMAHVPRWLPRRTPWVRRAASHALLEVLPGEASSLLALELILGLLGAQALGWVPVLGG
ncbi:MAG: isoprenylcysteine carboxylmethyltransferase family protein [Planctomycetes bacterium]|nr:isoprenylcysteine carboxylmethyltransferase family protein [Planctomycetota bacterium]